MRRERGAEREQRHDGDEQPDRAVAAGNAEAEVEIPRQEQREDQQGGRDAVAHGVGAGGEVADARRSGAGGRAGLGHLGGGRVVTLVAHVAIPS